MYYTLKLCLAKTADIKTSHVNKGTVIFCSGFTEQINYFRVDVKMHQEEQLHEVTIK